MLLKSQFCFERHRIPEEITPAPWVPLWRAQPTSPLATQAVGSETQSQKSQPGWKRYEVIVTGSGLSEVISDPRASWKSRRAQRSRMPGSKSKDHYSPAQI